MRSVLAFEETLARPEPSAPEPHPLADRLHACSRLLAVAADELEARERGDLTKRRELSQLREELVREIQPSPQDLEDEAAEGAGPEELLLEMPQQIARLLADALYELEEREEEERRMQDRWSTLEEDALKAMHVGGKIAALRAGRYPVQRPKDARLDLRF